MSNAVIECSVAIARPPGEIFGYLTMAKMLERWFPSSAETDPRAGGSYRFLFKRPDGSVDHEQTGTFVRVEPPNALSYDWDFGQGPTSVEVTLAERGGATRLTLRHKGFGAGAESQQARAMHEKGWNLFLRNLKSVVEEGKDQRASMTFE